MNIYTFGLILGVIAQTAFAAEFESYNLEEDAYTVMGELWEKMEKENDGIVTAIDFVNFYCRYDAASPACSGGNSTFKNPEFFVDENEFASGWMGDFPEISEDVARALFKRFDLSRWLFKDAEGIEFNDVTFALFYCDVDGDNQLNEEEFKVGLGNLQSDLHWGVMFLKYRRPINEVANYNDAIYTDGFDNIFDDIDGDGDTFLLVEEFITFFDTGNYGYPLTAVSWFTLADYNLDGAVDYLEWLALWDVLNFEEPEDGLSYDDFTGLDYLVRGA